MPCCHLVLSTLLPWLVGGALFTGEVLQFARAEGATTSGGIAPVTVSIFDQERSSDEYALVPVEYGAGLFLVSPGGRIAHSWSLDVDRARLLPNCNLLVVHTSNWGMNQPEWEKLRPVVREYRWDGSVAWEYSATDVVHHDVHRLPSGNTIFLRRMLVPIDFIPPFQGRERRGNAYNSSSVVEVTPQGEIAWQWDAHKHFDPARCGSRVCAEKPEQSINSVSRAYDWTHANTVSALPENRWYDQGDSRFKPGNILLMLRNFWSAYIIDRASNKIVWSYDGGEEPLGPAHEPNMIPKGLPGEGNILMFQNIVKRGEKTSAVIEVNPVTKKVVWRYSPGVEFFSGRSGSVQRLANGNTLVSSDKQGRAFEVTSRGEVVWEIGSRWEFNRVMKYPKSYCRQLKSLSEDSVLDEKN